MLLSLACLVSCGGGGGSSSSDGDGSAPVTFDSATTPGQVVSITVGSETVNMIYANNQTSITFPFSPLFTTPVDDQKATLTRKFFMSETQVTNALFAEVLQWAVDNGKIVETVGAHNEVSVATVKYGGQELIDLDYGSDYMKISYNATTNSFSVASGYEDHPAVLMTWYGAVMFCNWLTEMRNGNTDNVVYSGIDTTWNHTETVENASRSGYRLPSSGEWEFAARYIGTTAPTVEDLASEYIAQGHNGGHTDLTAGYYWTPALYASGAMKDSGNETETRAVAWYSGDTAMGGSDTLMPVSKKAANQLGLHDMSGNVWEWCFTADGSYRVGRGGSWDDNVPNARVGHWDSFTTNYRYTDVGIRIARTQ